MWQPQEHTTLSIPLSDQWKTSVLQIQSLSGNISKYYYHARWRESRNVAEITGEAFLYCFRHTKLTPGFAMNDLS
jgi:hypothetical protein